MLKMLLDINNCAADKALPQDRLTRLFENYWNNFIDQIDNEIKKKPKKLSSQEKIWIKFFKIF